MEIYATVGNLISNMRILPILINTISCMNILSSIAR